MPLNALYVRTLQEDGGRWLIHSTCRLCGRVIVGSVSDHLHDDEADHAEKCIPAELRSSSASASSQPWQKPGKPNDSNAA